MAKNTVARRQPVRNGGTRTMNRDSSCTVVVVGTNEVARRGITEMLLSEGVDAAESVSSLRDAESVNHGSADVLIVSSDIDRFDYDAALSSGNGRAHVLVLLRGSEPAQLAAGFSLRADGYLVESSLSQKSLIKAVAAVARGESVLPPESLTRTLFEYSGNVPRSRQIPPRLTGRELRVLSLVTGGMTNKEIARTLGISFQAVKRAMGSILAKLNSPNRAMAAARAIEERLVERETNHRTN